MGGIGDWSLILDAEPSARARAEALRRAFEGRRGLGQIFQLSGDRVIAPVGQGLATQAGDELRQLGQLGSQRAAMGHQAAQEAATQAYRQQQLDIQRRELGLKERSLDQDAWAFGQDATGGGFMFNKKTGAVVPLNPQGSFPGAGSGLKPAQFEADVQAYGKDVEPIAKAEPDIKALESAAAKGDVAGFGPLSGRVPDFAVSDEGVANRQAAGRLMAAIIQMISGQAASEKEVARQLQARGLGQSATDAQFQIGTKALRREYDNLFRQRQAKYHPSVVQTYEARGGFGGNQGPSGGDAPPVRRYTRGPDGKLVEVK